MRTIVAFLLASTLSAFSQTSVITGTVKAPDGTPWATEIQFLSKTTPIGLSGNLIPTKLTARTATNGTFSQALFPGSYQITIKGAPGANGWPDSVFYIYVTTNLGTYDITDLMTNAIALPAHVLLTKGSIYVWNGTNVVGLAAGGDGQVLTADAASATGLKYSSVSGTGTMRNVQSNGVAIGTDIVTLNIANPSAMTSNNGIVTVTLPTGGGSGGGDTNANFLFFGATNSAYPNGRALAVGGIISIATNGTNITITATEVGTVTDAQLAAGTNSVKNYADATFQPIGSYVTASITNGLAHTNWLPVVIAGSNATVVTNIVNGQAQYTVSSTATGSGSGLTNIFDNTQFALTDGTNVHIATGGLITNMTMYYPLSVGGPLEFKLGNDGLSLTEGVTEYLNFNNTNCYFTQPLFIPTPTEDLHAATKAYVDTAVAGAGSGTTNFPHLTATNGINILTNGTLTLYGVGYSDASSYRRLQIGATGNDFFIGSQTAGTGVGDGDLIFATQSTNRWQITPTGNWIAATDNAYDIGASSATRPKNIYAAGTVTASAFSGSLSGAIVGASTYSHVGLTYTRSPQAGVYSYYADSGSYDPFYRLEFGYSTTTNHPAINCTNGTKAGIFRITGALDKNATNPIVVFDHNAMTNLLSGTTTITNLVLTGINCFTPKSITNTWYSVNADRTATVTNEQVFIQGVLTSWKQNGTEL